MNLLKKMIFRSDGQECDCTIKSELRTSNSVKREVIAHTPRGDIELTAKLENNQWKFSNKN